MLTWWHLRARRTALDSMSSSSCASQHFGASRSRASAKPSFSRGYSGAASRGFNASAGRGFKFGGRTGFTPRSTGFRSTGFTPRSGFTGRGAGFPTPRRVGPYSNTASRGTIPYRRPFAGNSFAGGASRTRYGTSQPGYPRYGNSWRGTSSSAMPRASTLDTLRAHLNSLVPGR